MPLLRVYGIYLNEISEKAARTTELAPHSAAVRAVGASLRLTLCLTYSMLTVASKRGGSLDEVAIRPAIEEDVPRIIELYRDLTITTSEVEAGRNPSLDEYQRVFAEISAVRGHELLAIRLGQEVVGTLVLLIVPNLSHAASPWALLENLIIDLRYRRRGLGRMLMEHAISRARESGCYKIALSSDRGRGEAHDFYRSLGFEASAHGFRRFF